MSDELGFEELPPGRHSGTVEKVRYSFRATTQIIFTYKLQTSTGPRRLEERFTIGTPKSAANYFNITLGLGRVEDVLRILGKTIADADGLKSLPGLLEGTVVVVITQNRRVAGYSCPYVVRVEKP
jgi:hypothetical protein